MKKQTLPFCIIIILFTFIAKAQFVNNSGYLETNLDVIIGGTTVPQSNLQIGNGNSMAFDFGNFITFGKTESTSESFLPYIGHTSISGGNDLALGVRSTSASINFYTGNHATQFDDSKLRMCIQNNGNVGIGTINPTELLTVNGKILCEEVEVIANVSPDYVFQKYYLGSSTLKPEYIMPTLAEVEVFIKANHHLPEVPSAQEIQENGLLLKEMSNMLLQKIEELTLYTIEQEKRINALETKLNEKQ